MAIEIGLGQTALNTQTTVDFTSAKLSASPKAIFAFVGDGGVNGTENADLRLGAGFTDGSTDVGTSQIADDGGSSEDCSRIQNSGWVAQRTPTGSDQLTHNSFLSSGWRANLNNPGDFGKLALACMFGGSDVTAESGTSAIGDGTQQTVSLSNTGLTPNVIIFFGGGAGNGSVVSSFFAPTFGVAHDNGASIVQRCVRWQIIDGATEGDPRQIIDSDAAFGQENTYKVTVDSMSSGQFQFTASADSGSDDIQWLALQIDNANIALIDTDKPTSTGIHEETGPGFTPKFILELSTMLTALDTRATDSTAGVANFSLFNDTEEFSYSWADEDGSATIDSQSLTHDRAVYYDADDGTLAFDGVFNAFTSNGWEINYSTVDGTARKGFALAIGEAGAGADHDLTAQSIATSAPSVESASISQVHDLTAQNIETAAPTVDAPTISQQHDLTAANIETAAPTIDGPTISQNHDLTAQDVATANPAIASATISQAHSLTAQDIAAGNPTIEQATASENTGTTDDLTAQDIATAAPTIESATLTQRHDLTAQSITTASPTVGSTSISQNHDMAAQAIVAGAPIIDAPTLSQAHELTAQRIDTGAPTITAPSMIAALLLDGTVVIRPVLSGTASITPALAGTVSISIIPVLSGTVSIE